MKRSILLTLRESPGDVMMLTAAVRDLHRAHKDRYRIGYGGVCRELFENSPYVEHIPKPDEVIACGHPWIHRSNQANVHYVGAFHDFLSRHLGMEIPVTEPHGDIHLSDAERRAEWIDGLGIPDGFWVVICGGKTCYTAKWPNPDHLQKVVKHFSGKLHFVQCGEAAPHVHWPLEGVTNFIGRTSLRQFIQLMNRAAGVVCPVTFPMHLAAAMRKPAVVLAGGREPATWVGYNGQQYLSNAGTMPCSTPFPCWKSKCQFTIPGKEETSVCAEPVEIRPGLVIPRCMDRLTPPKIIKAVESYYEGGRLHWPDSAVAKLGRTQRIYPDRPIRVGIIIGTYAAVPYIRLQLESHRRFAPGVPLVVHDDHSPDAGQLAELCGRCGAEFVSTDRHMGHYAGDLSVHATGLEWAARNDIDLLVKFSRRFVPTAPWIDQLSELARQSQAATFSGFCEHYRFGFRTEAIGYHVPSWTALDVAGRIRRRLLLPVHELPEGYMHRFAREVRNIACAAAEKWYRENEGRRGDRDAYALWPILGKSRYERRTDRLWKEANPPADYEALARAWGINVEGGFAL